MGGYHGGGGVSTYTTWCGVVPGILLYFTAFIHILILFSVISFGGLPGAVWMVQMGAIKRGGM